MVDPTTANTSMSVPIRGSDVGTWDTPVNGNFNILDSMFGSVASIALSSTPVTLATSQAQCSIIRLTGTLLSNVAITMASINKFWTIDNQIVNSPSSFCVTLVSTSGASIIGCPPGQQDVFYDGTTMSYKNMGQIGDYRDYAGTGVPTWVTASTKPPFLNCDGTAFSSATYPVLANLLGTATLPDRRGTTGYTLNQGTGRLTTALGGLDGNTLGSIKTTQVTLSTSNLPPYTPAGTIANTASVKNSNYSVTGGGVTLADTFNLNGFNINSMTTIVSVFTGTPQGGVSNVLPVGSATVYGITMIRAA